MFNFSVDRTKTTRTRKLPLLPRVGFVVDVAGRRFTWRSAPLIETLLNLMEWGMTRSNFEKIQGEQLREIEFPGPRASRTLDVTARTVAETAAEPGGLFKRFTK